MFRFVPSGYPVTSLSNNWFFALIDSWGIKERCSCRMHPKTFHDLNQTMYARISESGDRTFHDWSVTIDDRMPTNQVFAVGGSGTRYHFDGEKWVKKTLTCEQRRAELIQKMVASGLSPEEEAELETLQLAAREEVGKRVPAPFSILEEK